MLLAAAPWFVAIGIATEGRFFAEAIGGDMLGKVGSGEEKHWGPPGYYLLTFGVAAFPAACRAAGAARGLGRPAAAADALPARLGRADLAAVRGGDDQAAALHPAALPGADAAGRRLGDGPAAAAPAALAALARRSPALALATPAGRGGLAAPWSSCAAWPTGGVPGGRRSPCCCCGSLLRAARRRRVRPRRRCSARCWPSCSMPRCWRAWCRGSLPLWIAPRLASDAGQRAPGPAGVRFGIIGYPEPSVVFALGTGHPSAAQRRGCGALPGRGARPCGRGRQPRRGGFPRQAAALGLALQEIGTRGGLQLFPRPLGRLDPLPTAVSQ